MDLKPSPRPRGDPGQTNLVLGEGRVRGCPWEGKRGGGASYTFILRPPWANMIAVGGINNQGQITGLINNGNVGPGHAFVWAAGVLTDVGTPSGMINLGGSGINELGTVVGTADSGPPPQ